MRIDKFLWSVRVYKTRSIASDEIKKNKVSIGDNIVKNSKEVKPGDLIKVKKNPIEFKIKVLALPKSRVGAKLVPEYIADRTEQDQYEILKLKKMQQSYYRAKGEGRPTKKDRRDIHEYMDNDEIITISNTDWDQFFTSIEDVNEEEGEV